MSFDTQKQIAFTGIKNSELQAINMATQSLKLENKGKAYNAMLSVLKQVRAWQQDQTKPFKTQPSVKDIILCAELVK
jgi:hypothetical protein